MRGKFVPVNTYLKKKKKLQIIINVPLLGTGKKCELKRMQKKGKGK